jgi:hypothetical protein
MFRENWPVYCESRGFGLFVGTIGAGEEFAFAAHGDAALPLRCRCGLVFQRQQLLSAQLR